MKLLRQTAAAVSVSALAVLGLQMSAGAAVPSISASDTTIPAGGSVNVTLGEPCLDSEGELTYGDVISSATSGDTHQETKGAGFIKGATGTFVFDTPGTYTISRFCDGQGLTSQVTITVTAPTTTTTTSTTTTETTTTKDTTATTPTPPTGPPGNQGNPNGNGPGGGVVPGGGKKENSGHIKKPKPEKDGKAKDDRKERNR